MNLEKQKLIVDLTEELSELENKLNNEKIKHLTPRIESLLNQAFEDFRDFFVERGFEVKREQNKSVADYKNSLKIELSIVDNQLNISTGKENAFIHVGEKGIIEAFVTSASNREDAQINLLKQRIEKAKREIERIKEAKVYYWFNGRRYENFRDVLNDIFNK